MAKSCFLTEVLTFKLFMIVLGMLISSENFLTTQTITSLVVKQITEYFVKHNKFQVVSCEIFCKTQLATTIKHSQEQNYKIILWFHFHYSKTFL